MRRKWSPNDGSLTSADKVRDVKVRPPSSGGLYILLRRTLVAIGPEQRLLPAPTWSRLGAKQTPLEVAQMTRLTNLRHWRQNFGATQHVHCSQCTIHIRQADARLDIDVTGNGATRKIVARLYKIPLDSDTGSCDALGSLRSSYFIYQNGGFADEGPLGESRGPIAAF